MFLSPSLAASIMSIGLLFILYISFDIALGFFKGWGAAELAESVDIPPPLTGLLFNLILLELVIAESFSINSFVLLESDSQRCHRTASSISKTYWAIFE